MRGLDETAEQGLPGLGVRRFGAARLVYPAMLAAAFAFVYADTAAGVVREWFGPTVSYGLIIFAVSVFMVWKRWGLIVRARQEPAVFRGTLLTAAGCLLLLAGKVSGTILLREVSIVVTLMGIILTVYGPERLGIMALPVAYLAFMFPFIPEFLTDYSIYFQLASASIASSVLSLTGMPVAREGQLIYLPHTALDVVRDCSGVHSIVTLVALALPMAFFSRKSRLAKTALVAASFFIGIIANGLRIALIGVWTKFRPDADIHGPSNLLLVSIFIVGFGIAALALLSRLLPDRKDEADVAPRMDAGAVAGGRSQAYAVAAACAVLVLAGVYAQYYRLSPVYPRKNLSDMPVTIGDWKSEGAGFTEVPFEGAVPTASVKRVYHDGRGNAAGLYVAYFAMQDQGSKIFSYQYGLTNEGPGESRLELPEPGGLAVNRTSYNTAKGRTDAYYWYLIDGKVVSGRYRAKLALIMNALVHARNNAAIVIVTREEGGGDPAEFIKAVNPVLESYITS